MMNEFREKIGKKNSMGKALKKENNRFSFGIDIEDEPSFQELFSPFEQRTIKAIFRGYKVGNELMARGNLALHIAGLKEEAISDMCGVEIDYDADEQCMTITLPADMRTKDGEGVIILRSAKDESSLSDRESSKDEIKEDSDKGLNHE